MPVLHGTVVAMASLAVTAIGTTLAEAIAPISETSPITIGLLLGVVGGVFYTGMTLKGIQKDIATAFTRMDAIDKHLESTDSQVEELRER